MSRNTAHGRHVSTSLLFPDALTSPHTVLDPRILGSRMKSCAKTMPTTLIYWGISRFPRQHWKHISRLTMLTPLLIPLSLPVRFWIQQALPRKSISPAVTGDVKILLHPMNWPSISDSPVCPKAGRWTRFSCGTAVAASSLICTGWYAMFFAFLVRQFLSHIPNILVLTSIFP